MNRHTSRIDISTIIATVIRLSIPSPKTVVPALWNFLPDFGTGMTVQIQGQLVGQIPRSSQLGSIVPVCCSFKVFNQCARRACEKTTVNKGSWKDNTLCFAPRCRIGNTFGPLKEDGVVR